jgi:hypothetical protein
VSLFPLINRRYFKILILSFRPWALALGTPVLVIAGLLHLIHDCVKKRINKITDGPIRKQSVHSISEA